MVKETWWSPRALRLHAVIIIIVPAFAGLCAWQTQRAVDGNSLSWAYVFEWPFFAEYAIYMWWRFLHEAPGGRSASAAAPQSRSTSADDAPTTGGSALAPDPEEAERAAYNQYLTELSSRGKRKQWR